MRTKEEIMEYVKTSVPRDHGLLVEILLDIRELLANKENKK